MRLDERAKAKELVEEFIARNPDTPHSRDLLYSWFVNCILIGLTYGALETYNSNVLKQAENK